MPRTYSNVAYANMAYGICNGNTTETVGEYAYRFPNRKMPNRQVITFNRLQETDSFSIHQNVKKKICK